MNQDPAALRAAIARYRRSLIAVDHPDVIDKLEQMIKDAETRLAAVEGHYAPTS